MVTHEKEWSAPWKIHSISRNASSEWELGVSQEEKGRKTVQAERTTSSRAYMSMACLGNTRRYYY